MGNFLYHVRKTTKDSKEMKEHRVVPYINTWLYSVEVINMAWYRVKYFDDIVMSLDIVLIIYHML